MTNKLELHRRVVTAANLDYYGASYSPRRTKRYFTRYNDAVTEAFYWGSEQLYRRRPISNPYPAGVRYDAFNYGLRNEDPMGSFNGKNE